MNREFDRLADLGLARVSVSWGWPPGIKLTDAGMAEARSPGAGLALLRAEATPLVPPKVDGPDPTLRPEERLRRADPPIPRPGSDPDRLAVLADCMENGTIGDPLTEWPHNLISRWTVVDETGAISRLTLSPRRRVDPTELATCRRLAEEAAGLMAGVNVGMGSAGDDEFAAFFIAATTSGAIPRRIDEELIRSRFGGTIFPMANILVEPVAEEGRWWGEATSDGNMVGVDELAPWRAMMRWFREQQEFVDVAFVSIGDGSLSDLLADEQPSETELVGCVWPRLVLGLTRNGSLAGIFGVTIRA